MRITHVIDYFHTDVCYQEFYLAHAQALSGHDVSVVSSRYRHQTVAVSGDETPGERLLAASGVRVVRLAGRQLGHDRAWLQDLRTRLRNHQPDVVQCHGAFGPTTVRVARECRRSDIPLLVDNHCRELNSPAAESGLGQLGYGAYRALFGRLLRTTTASWVAVGPDEGAFLENRLGVPMSQIELIPLGFDPSAFYYDHERRKRLRSERGWSSDRVVVATGKFTKAKRLDAIASACERENLDEVRLVLAGVVDSRTLDEVRSMIPSLVAAGRFTVLPMLSRQDLADLYLAADLAVFPRPSISVFEAAGTGLPVMLAQDRYAVWLQGLLPLIQPYTSEALSIRNISPTVDRSLAAQAARAEFSWEVISERFVDCYLRIRGDRE